MCVYVTRKEDLDFIFIFLFFHQIALFVPYRIVQTSSQQNLIDQSNSTERTNLRLSCEKRGPVIVMITSLDDVTVIIFSNTNKFVKRLRQSNTLNVAIFLWFNWNFSTPCLLSIDSFSRFKYFRHVSFHFFFGYFMHRFNIINLTTISVFIVCILRWVLIIELVLLRYMDDEDDDNASINSCHVAFRPSNFRFLVINFDIFQTRKVMFVFDEKSPSYQKI